MNRFAPPGWVVADLSLEQLILARVRRQGSVAMANLELAMVWEVLRGSGIPLPDNLESWRVVLIDTSDGEPREPLDLASKGTTQTPRE